MPREATHDVGASRESERGGAARGRGREGMTVASVLSQGTNGGGRGAGVAGTNAASHQ